MNNKDNFVKRLMTAKKGAERGLQAVGTQIRKNVDAGQKDFKSGKAKYYASINPLKGAGSAFKRGYGSQ